MSLKLEIEGKAEIDAANDKMLMIVYGTAHPRDVIRATVEIMDKEGVLREYTSKNVMRQCACCRSTFDARKLWSDLHYREIARKILEYRENE